MLKYKRIFSESTYDPKKMGALAQLYINHLLKLKIPVMDLQGDMLEIRNYSSTARASNFLEPNSTYISNVFFDVELKGGNVQLMTIQEIKSVKGSYLTSNQKWKSEIIITVYPVNTDFQSVGRVKQFRYNSGFEDIFVQ